MLQYDLQKLLKENFRAKIELMERSGIDRVKKNKIRRSRVMDSISQLILNMIKKHRKDVNANI